MVQWFKRLQELPTFENEETARIAALLRMGLPLGFSLNLAFFLAIIVFVPHQTVFQLALLGGLALEITGFWLLKRGYARISAWLVIIFASAMTTAVLFVLGPNYESNFITHLVIVLFAGLILGARSVPLIGGISLVSWAIGLIGYNAGWLHGRNYPMDFEYRLISDIAIFVFSCVFIFWTAYKTEQALIQSRNTTQALQRALDDLQHTTISRIFLDNILQSMAEMLVVLDMEGQIVMVNESLLNCLGYAQAELIGQPFQRISVAGISDTVSVETLLTASPVRYSESTYRAQDGSEVAVLFSSHPLAGENGQVQGVVCVAQDITEQLRNRQAMLNSEKRFLAVAEASQTAVIMMSKTNILYTNAAAERILGCSKEDIQHINPALLFAEEERERLMTLFQGMIEEGGDPIQLELQIIDCNHQGKWVYCSAASTNLDNEQTLVITALDISARKRDEVELIRSQALKSAFLEASLDALVLIEQDGTILEYNPAAERIFGYSRSEAVGSNINTLLVPEKDQQMYPLQLSRYEVGNSSKVVSQRFEIMAMRKDKVTIPVELTVSSVHLEGKILFAAHMRDITEQIKAKEAERTANAEKERVRVLTEFVRNSSHDFRTPLASINTSLYLLQRSEDQQKRTQYATTIAQQTDRLEKLIEGMIKMVQLDSEAEFERQSIDLNGLIRDVSVRIQSLAVGKSQNITMNLADNVPHMRVAGQEIGRVLVEILENAVIFTGDGGEITIATTVVNNSDAVEISIRDNGIGISPQDLPLIFNRFYRADPSRSTETGGIGLGLSIAQKIAQRHGGQITVESILGEGSTFRVTLPIQQDPLTTSF